MNSLEQGDLKAFERTLTTCHSTLENAAYSGDWTATGAWNWLIKPETQKAPSLTALRNCPLPPSSLSLTGLLSAGTHGSGSTTHHSCSTSNGTGRVRVFRQDRTTSWKPRLSCSVTVCTQRYGTENSLFQISGTAESHTGPLLQLEGDGAARLTRSVQHSPGIVRATAHVVGALAPLVICVSVFVSLQYFGSCKHFCRWSESITELNWETEPRPVFIMYFC